MKACPGSGEVAVSDAAAGDGDDEALVDASDYDDDDDEYDEAEAAAIELEMEVEDPEILAEAEASRAAAEENYATCDDQPGADPEQALDDSRAAMEDFLLNHKRKSGIAAAAIASLERSLRCHPAVQVVVHHSGGRRLALLRGRALLRRAQCFVCRECGH